MPQGPRPGTEYRRWVESARGEPLGRRSRALKLLEGRQDILEDLASQFARADIDDLASGWVAAIAEYLCFPESQEINVAEIMKAMLVVSQRLGQQQLKRAKASIAKELMDHKKQLEKLLVNPPMAVAAAE